MRQLFAELDLFTGPCLPHSYALELEAIDQILRDNPRVARLVWRDLKGGAPEDGQLLGRPGLAAEQVLRAAIIKQMNEFSYEELAFHLADSRTYMRFCGFTHPLEVPQKSALADNIKRLSPTIWHEINHVLLGYAKDEGIEDGEQARIDPTVAASNILHPTDNGLLFECAEVFARILECARKSFGIRFHNRVKSAKRHHMSVSNAKRKEQRLEPYKKLLAVTREMIRHAEAAVPVLRRKRGPFSGVARGLADELSCYLTLAHRVVGQTERRALHGESVPPRKSSSRSSSPTPTSSRRTTATSTMATRSPSPAGPAGSSSIGSLKTAIPPIALSSRPCSIARPRSMAAIPDRLPQTGGWPPSRTSRPPRSAASSTSSLPRNAASPSRTWPPTPSYRALRNFRAGIDGVISFLKRVFGLGRVTWKGKPSFDSYVSLSVVSANLLVLARHLTG